jgi:hypothetical protein
VTLRRAWTAGSERTERRTDPDRWQVEQERRVASRGHEDRD